LADGVSAGEVNIREIYASNLRRRGKRAAQLPANLADFANEKETRGSHANCGEDEQQSNEGTKGEEPARAERRSDNGPLAPALSPSEGERQNCGQSVSEAGAF